MADFEPGDLGALEKAVNDTAGKASALWLSFIFFATLLIITVGSVTHRHLLLEKDLKLPVLNVELPLLGFFFAVPLFFLVFHFYAFLQLHGLAMRVAAYNKRLREEVTSSDARSLVRQRLDPFVFVQMLAGAQERRSGSIGWSNRLVAWITMVGLPLVALLLIQLTFLPYHHGYTWLHRGAVLVDLGLVWVFWRKLTVAKAADGNPSTHPFRRSVLKLLGPHRIEGLERLWRRVWHGRAKAIVDRINAHWRTRMPRPSTALAVAASFAVGLLAMIAAYPTEAIYTWTRQLTETLFEGGVDEVNSRPSTWFGLSNVLVLPDQDLGVAEKLKALRDAGEPERTSLSLRGRDLAGAVLDLVDLRQADFTGAVLRRASLQGANLEKAHFECGEMGRMGDRFQLWGRRCVQAQGAVFRGARLQGVLLSEANLEGAALDFAQLQGGGFGRAQLQGASLRRAQLQGAYFVGSNLQGASLEDAQLQGARVDGVRIEDRWYFTPELDGASLSVRPEES